jgi:hypothetical protein
MQVLWPLLQIFLFMIGVFLVIQVPFMLLTFFVARRETHRNTVYVPIDESRAMPTNGYMDHSNAAARELGFDYVALCRAGNEKLYKIRYDMWISQDRQVFTTVGAGKAIGIPQQSTWLTTKLVDGRVLVTVDHPSGIPVDLSGMISCKVITNADFPELLARHRARVESEMTPVEPYSLQDPLGDHLALIAARTERMARAGYLDYLDEREDTWRFNTRGAFACVLQQHAKAFSQILRNYGREKVKRPGQYGYIPSQKIKTRSWLRYAELGCWIAIIVVGRLANQPAATPQQALFRLLVPLAAAIGLVTIWVVRWKIGRTTVDPSARRRMRFKMLGLICLMFVGCYMIKPDRRSMDNVADCKVLVGGGKAYVVVESIHAELRTSRLADLLGWAGRPQFPMVTSVQRHMQIFESDGDLYLIEPFGESRASRWQDGQLVPVPDDERKKIYAGLAEEFLEQCESQGWEYTSLGDVATPAADALEPGELRDWESTPLPRTNGRRFSRTVSVGGKEVGLILEFETDEAKPNVIPTQSLRVTVRVPGSQPLTQTFPDPRGKGL